LLASRYHPTVLLYLLVPVRVVPRTALGCTIEVKVDPFSMKPFAIVFAVWEE
jgi:hypothetical protein